MTRWNDLAHPNRCTFNCPVVVVLQRERAKLGGLVAQENDLIADDVAELFPESDHRKTFDLSLCAAV